MARITKEILGWISSWEDAEAECDWAEGRMHECYNKLKELGMSDKQLKDRNIYSPY